MNYSKELTMAVREAQGFTFDMNGPLRLDGSDLLWLSKEVALAVLREEHQDHGEISSDRYHPAGPGPLAWGQCLAAIDALDEAAGLRAWEHLAAQAYAHQAGGPSPGYELTASPEENQAAGSGWWSCGCVPNERGPWGCVAILKAVAG